MYDDEPKSTLLRRALKTNVVLSALSGIVLASGANLIGPLIGFDLPSLYIVTGAGLVVFAYWVWIVATRPVIKRRHAQFILWLDILWVLSSAILLFGFSQFLTIVGIVMITAAAVLVAAFSVAEYAGIRRISL